MKKMRTSQTLYTRPWTKRRPLVRGLATLVQKSIVTFRGLNTGLFYTCFLRTCFLDEIGEVSFRCRSARQRIVFKAFTQRRFLDFSGCGMGNFVNKDDIVRHPPLGDLTLHEGKDLVSRRGLSFLQHDDEKLPFVPFRMPHAYDGGLEELGLSDSKFCEVNRGNPLPARFDDILSPIGDLHVAETIDGGDVAGIEKSLLVKEVAAVTFEVGLGDGNAAHFEPP